MVVIHDCDKGWPRIRNNLGSVCKMKESFFVFVGRILIMDHHKLYLLRKRPLNRRQWAKRLIIASQLIMLWVIYVVWCKLWSNWKLYPHFGRLFLISKLRYTCIYKNQFLCRFDYSLINLYFFRLPCMHHG